MFYTQSIKNYLDALASNQPTPGGGAAAALTGAQGIALLCMVCRLTLGKKRFATHENELTNMVTTFEQQRQYFLDLAQQDIEVFQQVISAYQLPKNTPVEIATRQATIQLALKAASKIPFQLFQSCNLLLPLANTLETIGNPTVVSDIIVGKNLLFSSLLGARANVEANLVMITDQEFCQNQRNIITLSINNLKTNFLALWPSC